LPAQQCANNHRYVFLGGQTARFNRRTRWLARFVGDNELDFGAAYAFDPALGVDLVEQIFNDGLPLLRARRQVSAHRLEYADLNGFRLGPRHPDAFGGQK
jgi:hypothetical protein